ncbi:MAG: type II toxin-antitoxin system VapC family toxin [Verrucomicrobia bacterium]|nr:type II toxin-antitoxin system VapC family toxin [Verrucomicrobiota bacterium]
MNAAYYDANYIFKLQCGEDGAVEVSAHAATVEVLICSLLGRAELASAAFRKVREGTATAAQYQALHAQVHDETTAGHLEWLPLTDAILDRVESVFATAPATTYLRAADALHLATAAEHGFAEIYSNDKHLLAAAPLFGLRGVNVIL